MLVPTFLFFIVCKLGQFDDLKWVCKGCSKVCKLPLGDTVVIIGMANVCDNHETK